VREAGERALSHRAQPWTIAAADWFGDVERLREVLARLVGGDADGVALIPATSYGFAVAARNLALTRGDRILVLAEEYPSGIYTWRELARERGAELLTVEREPGGSWTEAILAAVDERVAIVSVPNVHWTDGALVDLDAIAARTHELGCRLVIDASQSLGAMPLDLDRLRPDYLVSVGYKWQLGAFGIAYLYVAPQHRDGQPIEQNWINRANAQDFAALVDYRDDYAPGARRFDMGARTSFHLVPIAIAAVEQLLEWEVPRIAATLSETTAALAAGAQRLGLEPAPTHLRGPHMLGIAVPEPAKVSASLAAANCFAGVRGHSLRLAPHLHSTPEDVEQLLAALAGALESGG
jgi:selenocysteine lyase/cysteine desulfurase